MANKDHSLDDGIVRAAYEEFLACGFEKASLHKIAKNAGVTTGAIYTRYKNKDALFASLLEDFFAIIQSKFLTTASVYEKARESGTVEALQEAIVSEEKIYMELFLKHYEECRLFFCCSDGSSVETMIKGMMEKKTEQTVAFFRETCGKEPPNASAVRLLMGSQFWDFRQILDARLGKEEMSDCLQTIFAFTNAGWKQFYENLK